MLTRILSLFMIVGILLTPGTSATTTATGAMTTAAMTSPASEQVLAQFIVTVKAGPDARTVATAAGATPRHVYRRALNGFVATLTAGQRTALERHPDVAMIEPDQRVEATATQTIDLTNNPGLWGLDRIDQRTLPLAGSYSYGGSGAGVNAYLIDSGVQANYPDFGTRAQNVYDVYGGDGADCHGHGTHLAGIIGGATYGVAKQVDLRGVRVLDCNAQGTVGNSIAGIDWVAANAVKPATAIIAFSPVNLDSGNSVALQIAVENLINSGVFVAVAAGNGNVDASAMAPANIATAFTVAASTSSDSRTSFSNYGACCLRTPQDRASSRPGLGAPLIPSAAHHKRRPLSPVWRRSINRVWANRHQQQFTAG